MLVELEVVGVLDGEALELVVVAHLVGGGHLEGADGDRLAVDLDRADGVHESVELQEVLRGRLDLDAGLRDKRVLDLLLGVFLRRRSVLLGLFGLGLDQDLVRLPHEHASELVDLVLVLSLHLRELGEVEVGARAPVEGFDGELVAALEVKPGRDVVVLFDALDLAPENDLVEVGVLRQFHERELQLHPRKGLGGHARLTSPGGSASCRSGSRT